MRYPLPQSTHGRRGLIFCMVGALGAALQLTTLILLTQVWAIPYLMATALAIEMTLIHNFACHARWTWQDRTPENRWALAHRFRHFQLTIGTLTFSQNLVLMPILVGLLGIHVLIANGIVIVGCSIINYVVNDRFVFKGVSACASHES